MKLHISKIQTTREVEKTLETLSPFEIKNELIRLAEEKSLKSTISMLNAGRGNPNWIATVPREAFFLFGQYAIQECQKNFDEKGIMAGIVQDKAGASERFLRFLDAHPNNSAAELLRETFNYGVEKYQFDADSWIREWIEAVIGFNYPVPDRMLKFIEVIVRDYVLKEMGIEKKDHENYDVFAVEGGTAAMCYIFDTLMQNFLIKRGDRIALLTPTFTPYIEIPELDRYSFDVVYVQASSSGKNGFHTWQYPKEELDKLKDPTIKIAFIVNPSNPPSTAMDDNTLDYIKSVVENHNPGLMIITDDVYGTFVNDFKSVLNVLPHNTINVYSFSKYFGCTGWRLGTITVNKDNMFDKKIAGLSKNLKLDLSRRYSSLTLEPEKMRFIDRLVADSRQVALNHTAGLSLPQQFQMLLFSSFCLLDKEDVYKKLTQSIINKRLSLLWEGLEVDILKDPNRAGYYSEIDIEVAAKHFYGEEFVSWLKENFEPVDVLFRLAERTAIVLLNGGGFAGPEWSIRVSLANLPTESYLELGKNVRSVLLEYVKAWENSKK